MSIAHYHNGEGFKKLSVDRELISGTIKSNKLKAFLLIQLSFLVGASIESDIQIMSMNSKGTSSDTSYISFKFSDGNGRILSANWNFAYLEEHDRFDYLIEKSDLRFSVGDHYLIASETSGHMFTGKSTKYSTHELPKILTITHLETLSNELSKWLTDRR